MADQVGDVPDPDVTNVAGTSVAAGSSIVGAPPAPPATLAPAVSPGTRGLTAFFQEDYVTAAALFQQKCGHGNLDPQCHWCELRAHAETNASNRYQHGLVTVPPSKASLLQPPALALRAPLDLEPMPELAGVLRRLVAAGNKLLGLILKPGFDVVVRLVGGKGEEQSWRTWPTRKHFLLRDLGLAAIRNYMNHNSLQDPYGGRLVGDQNPGQYRPEWTERYRTATGAWNTDNPMEGAAGTRFIWQGNELSPRTNSVHDDPNPLAVARELLHFDGHGERATVDFLNLLAIGWIQFMVHDWVNHRQEDGGEIYVPFPADDPRIQKYGRDGMTFRRTQPSIVDGSAFGFENEVTGWWDGSQIYGSDQFTQDRLRAHNAAAWVTLLDFDHRARQTKTYPPADQYDPRTALSADGKLYVERNQPPIDPDTGVIDSGFTRNMWVGLEIFHTLFVRHHNWLCERYTEEHPNWSSDQIFNHARLENAATIAKIHTIEWTPAVLPTEELALGMNFNWHGMLETLRRPYEERKPLRTFNPVHPLLGGLVGGEVNNFGVPQNFSEQFVEVYRLHAAMPDEIELRPIGSAAGPSIRVERTRSAGSRKTIDRHGLETLLNAFGHQHMNALVNNNYPKFMTDMSVEGAPMLDLAAADIVRARERGVPRFNEFRQQLGMPEMRCFKELTSCEKTISRLTALYGGGKDGVDRMDVTVGMLCDTRDRPVRGFDTTRFAVFLQSASRRLQTDPFFTEKYNERYYTRAGLARIDGVTLKKLLFLHVPDLRHTGLRGVRNAFEPWGTTKDTAPREHPLAFIERYRDALP